MRVQAAWRGLPERIVALIDFFGRVQGSNPVRLSDRRVLYPLGYAPQAISQEFTSGILVPCDLLNKPLNESCVLKIFS